MSDARPGAGAIGMLFFASPTPLAAITTLSEYQHCWNPGEHQDISISDGRLAHAGATRKRERFRTDPEWAGRERASLKPMSFARVSWNDD